MGFWNMGSISGGEGGTTNHAELSNLSYEQSGHTGFVSTVGLESHINNENEQALHLEEQDDGFYLPDGTKIINEVVLQDFDSKEAWETWQNLDPVNNTLDFEDWLKMMIRPGMVQGFRTYMTNPQNFPSGIMTIIKSTIKEGIGSIDSDGKYIVPIEGWWQFNATAGANNSSNTSALMGLRIETIEEGITKQYTIGANGHYGSIVRLGTSGLFYCKKGDKVFANMSLSIASSIPSDWVGNDSASILSGFLVGGAGTGEGIGEAPLNGKQYARQDGDWEEVEIGKNFNWRGDFQLGNMYNTNDIVMGADGNDYIAIADGLVLPPPSPGWDTFVQIKDGFSPIITVVENTDESYVLGIETADNFFETPNLLKQEVRVPVTVRASTIEGVLANQPISIQAAGSGLQKTILDENGEFRSTLRPEREYTFKVMQKDRDDLIFPLPHKVTTGTLDIPLEVDIPVMTTNIYANPWDWEEIKEIIESNSGITVTRTTSAFGNLGSGGYKWVGSTLAQDGMIYCTPCNASTVLVIDPITKTTSTFGNLGSGENKWHGSALAQDGMIYCAPHYTSAVLVIDPITKTTSTFGNLGSGSKWIGSILAQDGMIYCAPCNASTVLVIDPITKTTSTFGNLGSGGYKWIGSTLVQDGMIYCTPYNASAVLVIDPITKTTSTFGNLGSGGNKWQGSTLALSGNIYCVPFDNSSVLEISLSDNLSRFSPTALQSAWLNKF